MKDRIRHTIAIDNIILLSLKGHGLFSNQINDVERGSVQCEICRMTLVVLVMYDWPHCRHESRVRLETGDGDTVWLDEAARSGFGQLSDVVDVDQATIAGKSQWIMGGGTYVADVICRLSPRKIPTFLIPLTADPRTIPSTSLSP